MGAQIANRRVLVVDDNPNIHRDFQKLLNKDAQADERLDDLVSSLFDVETEDGLSDSFEMDSAYQGEEALAKVQEALQKGRPYAVAFVDMRMPPGWDGAETISHLWAADPALQVVICTAYSDYSWDEILRRLGRRENLAVLKKPFDNIEVTQLCEMLCKKWELGCEE